MAVLQHWQLHPAAARLLHQLGSSISSTPPDSARLLHLLLSSISSSLSSLSSASPVACFPCRRPALCSPRGAHSPPAAARLPPKAACCLAAQQAEILPLATQLELAWTRRLPVDVVCLTFGRPCCPPFLRPLPIASCLEAPFPPSRAPALLGRLLVLLFLFLVIFFFFLFLHFFLSRPAPAPAAAPAAPAPAPGPAVQLLLLLLQLLLLPVAASPPLT